MTNDESLKDAAREVHYTTWHAHNLLTTAGMLSSLGLAAEAKRMEQLGIEIQKAIEHYESTD